jgi:hydrogenase maturation factor
MLINVSNCSGEIIARVEVNELIASGLGITRLVNGEYVLIHLAQTLGRMDYAETVEDEKVLQVILKQNPDLLEDPKFSSLKDLWERNKIEEEILSKQTIRFISNLSSF